MAKINRWGGSLGVRLPKEIASAAGLVSGSIVTVRLLDSGDLLVRLLNNRVAIALTDATSVKRPREVTKW
ncbi:AbrB/MazE/SpoVT family DNA-binding domain-containing protein [Massilia eurypsychrophila]